MQAVLTNCTQANLARPPTLPAYPKHGGYDEFPDGVSDPKNLPEIPHVKVSRRIQNYLKRL